MIPFIDCSLTPSGQFGQPYHGYSLVR